MEKETVTLKRRLPDEKDKRIPLNIQNSEYDRRERYWQRWPCVYIFLVLGTYFILAHLTQMVEDSMPTPKFDEDLPIDESELNFFSEQSGWYYLLRIIGDKPRVAGTKYHLKKTEDLKNLLGTLASDMFLPLKIDWQVASGDFSLNSSTPSVNSYHKVSNIIALLEGQSGVHENKSIGSTILVNCHYDSVPGAPGASDNGIFCATMVVAIQKLGRRLEKLKHNIVFLFNGAEENPLQGSHAFLQHPWAQNIIAVINLDAAGMNGKANLFQVTDNRVLRAYQRTCQRPSAQSIGELIFASGLIPSGTDFQIWRDFGKIYGVDLAFIKWGHVYHTFNDDPKWVRSGVIQEAGDMLLSLIRELADDSTLVKQPRDPSSMVYFDYLNLTLLVYPTSVANIVDAIIVLLAAFSVYCYVIFVGHRWSTVHELAYAIGGRILATLGGALFVGILTLFSASGNMQLRYLSHPWLVVAIYWVPYLIGAVSVAHLFDAWRTRKTGLNRMARTLQASAATRSIFAVLLLLQLCVPKLAQMRYVFSVPLLGMVIVSFVTLILNKFVRVTAYQHLILEIALTLPIVMFLFSLSLRINALMLPIMGRNSSDKPDYIVAILNLMLVILTTTAVSGIELLFSRRRMWLVMASLMALCLLAAFKTMDPYVSPATQRHVWFHTEIKTINFNKEVESNRSGVFIFKWDTHTIASAREAFEKYQYKYIEDTYLKTACEESVYCNMPLYRIVMGPFMKDSMFILTSPPGPFTPLPEVRLMNASCDGDICEHYYSMIGASHNIITIWPHKAVHLRSWTFSSPVRAAFTQKGRPVYVIAHSIATYSNTVDPLFFTLTFRVPSIKQGGPIVDLSHHSHRVQHPEDLTSDFLWLTKAAPDFFSLVPFISFRTNYVF